LSIEARTAAGDAGVRAALRADAGFEVVLGLMLVTGPATGLLDSLDLPSPASDGVAVAFGALLLPFAVALWVWAGRDRPQAGPLGLLAAINAFTGLVLAIWIVVRSGDAPAGGVAFVLAVAAVLLGLAAAQSRLR
jgi:hypothetical protein